MKIELDKRFKKKLQGRFGMYDIEVGILKDEEHRIPAYKLKEGKDKLGRKRKLREYKYDSYATAKTRVASRYTYGTMISEVSEKFRKEVNYLVAPFYKRSAAVRLLKEFFNVVTGKSQPKRLKNLLQAIVRNPIIKKKYGGNTKATRKAKGFSHYMLDTGQLVKSIQARVVKRRV